MRNWLSIYNRSLICDAPRSGCWPTVRRHHLAVEGWCRMCGSTRDLEVHHIQPFHLFPMQELDPGNLITLCETFGVECHLRHGHLGNWKTFNPQIRAQANSPRPGVPAKPVLLSAFRPSPGSVAIALVKGTDFMSRMIQRITRSPYSHALILCGDGSAWESVPGAGVTHTPSFSAKYGKAIVDIFQMPMDEEKAAAIIAFCEAQKGKPYDWKGDYYFVTGGTEQPGEDTSAWFCSELVFAAFAAAGINLLDRIQPWLVSPGMLAYSPLLDQEAA